jgi:hypothetical protein
MDDHASIDDSVSEVPMNKKKKKKTKNAAEEAAAKAEEDAAIEAAIAMSRAERMKLEAMVASATSTFPRNELAAPNLVKQKNSNSDFVEDEDDGLADCTAALSEVDTKSFGDDFDDDGVIAQETTTRRRKKKKKTKEKKKKRTIDQGGQSTELLEVKSGGEALDDWLMWRDAVVCDTMTTTTTIDSHSTDDGACSASATLTLGDPATSEDTSSTAARNPVHVQSSAEDSCLANRVFEATEEAWNEEWLFPKMDDLLPTNQGEPCGTLTNSSECGANHDLGKEGVSEDIVCNFEPAAEYSDFESGGRETWIDGSVSDKRCENAPRECSVESDTMDVAIKEETTTDTSYALDDVEMGNVVKALSDSERGFLPMNQEEPSGTDTNSNEDGTDHDYGDDGVSEAAACTFEPTAEFNDFESGWQETVFDGPAREKTMEPIECAIYPYKDSHSRECSVATDTVEESILEEEIVDKSYSLEDIEMGNVLEALSDGGKGPCNADGQQQATSKTPGVETAPRPTYWRQAKVRLCYGVLIIFAVVLAIILTVVLGERSASPQDLSSKLHGEKAIEHNVSQAPTSAVAASTAPMMLPTVTSSPLVGTPGSPSDTPFHRPTLQPNESLVVTTEPTPGSVGIFEPVTSAVPTRGSFTLPGPVTGTNMPTVMSIVIP